MNLIKSEQRVGDHGELFTPEWTLDAMLDLVKDESERIDSRFAGFITKSRGCHPK